MRRCSSKMGDGIRHVEVVRRNSSSNCHVKCSKHDRSGVVRFRVFDLNGGSFGGPEDEWTTVVALKFVSHVIHLTQEVTHIARGSRIFAREPPSTHDDSATWEDNPFVGP